MLLLNLYSESYSFCIGGIIGQVYYAYINKYIEYQWNLTVKTIVSQVNIYVIFLRVTCQKQCVRTTMTESRSECHTVPTGKYTTCFSMDTQVPQPEYSPWKHFSPLLGSRDLTSGLCGKGFSAELSCQSRLAGIFIDSWGRKDERKVHYFHTKRRQQK